MNNQIQPQNFEELHLEVINCRNTVLNMDESLIEIEEKLIVTDSRKDQVLSLRKKVSEKRQQLAILEDILMRQKVVSSSSKNSNSADTNILRRAIDLRMNTHKVEIKETREYFNMLFCNAQAA